MIKQSYLILLLTVSLFGLTKEQRIIKASLHPYTVKNITYYPHKLSVGESKDILASWYGEYFHGRLTALGEVYDMNGFSAAHKTYPLGTVLKVTNPANGVSLNVRINDRGPFWGKRELDLSKGSAEYLGTKEQGVAPVHIEVISVPAIARSNSIVARKAPKVARQVALNKSNITIYSYAIVNRDETNIPIEFGRFKSLKEARKYEKKVKKYLPFSYILNYEKFYKIKSYLPADEKRATWILRKLKKHQLIKKFGLLWSYK
jgi:rare lipoprotein A